MQEEYKRRAAEAALDYVEPGTVIGIGTGTTVRHFITALARVKHRVEAAVASSGATEALLKESRIPLVDLNSAGELPLYIDGTDEATRHRYLIKGGGGALTREKVVAAASRRFVCILDSSKIVDVLGRYPLPVEVIPMARSYVARQIVKLGGQPIWRSGFLTDNGNAILDCHHLTLVDPPAIEAALNNIAGVVCNGLFAHRRADIMLIAGPQGVEVVN